MEPKTAHTAEVPWEELSEFPGKGQVKVLRDEGGSNAKTLLIELGAGDEITPHTHVAAVQHYILTGEYESEGKTYGAGTYRLFPGHANLASISTQHGATILLIYDPVG